MITLYAIYAIYNIIFAHIIDDYVKWSLSRNFISPISTLIMIPTVKIFIMSMET